MGGERRTYHCTGYEKWARTEGDERSGVRLDRRVCRIRDWRIGPTGRCNVSLLKRSMTSLERKTVPFSSSYRAELSSIGSITRISVGCMAARWENRKMFMNS